MQPDVQSKSTETFLSVLWSWSKLIPIKIFIPLLTFKLKTAFPIGYGPIAIFRAELLSISLL